MSDDVIEVWLTKRALVVGVEKTQVRASRLGLPFVAEACGAGQTYVLGEEAHLNREEAIAVAEADRERRIRVLEDQIARLRGLDFGA